MKKFALAITGAAAALAMSTAAGAQTFSPSSGSVSGSGSATLSQSTTVTCTVALTASMGATNAPIPTRSISGPGLCFLVVPYGSWSMRTVPGDATKIDVTMGANTVANEPCYGTVRANWNNTTKQLTIPSATLPPVNPAHRTCTISNAVINAPGLSVI